MESMVVLRGGKCCSAFIRRLACIGVRIGVADINMTRAG